MRPRELVVDGVSYLWTVNYLDEAHVILKAWFAVDSKRFRHVEVRVRFDDPWLNLRSNAAASTNQAQKLFHLQPLTPRHASVIIRQAVAQGWRTGERGAPLRFHWAGEQGLISISDA